MEGFDRLVGIMARLRAPGGCPWDREQDHLSIRRYVIEEAFEVAEAIDREDPQELCQELGDLLLQVVFHGQIASESGHFDIGAICEAISEKMVRRHPHVFGSLEVRTSADVVQNWEAIKAIERGGDASLIDGVPRALPALQRAERLADKAAKGGFDWPNADAVLEKVAEEAAELSSARETEGSQEVAEEFGDLLFSLTNLARKLSVDAEQALAGASRRFEARFRHAEQSARDRGKTLLSLSDAERDTLWQEAKTAGRDARSEN